MSGLTPVNSVYGVNLIDANDLEIFYKISFIYLLQQKMNITLNVRNMTKKKDSDTTTIQ